MIENKPDAIEPSNSILLLALPELVNPAGCGNCWHLKATFFNVKTGIYCQNIRESSKIISALYGAGGKMPHLSFFWDEFDSIGVSVRIYLKLREECCPRCFLNWMDCIIRNQVRMFSQWPRPMPVGSWQCNTKPVRVADLRPSTWWVRCYGND